MQFCPTWQSLLDSGLPATKTPLLFLITTSPHCINGFHVTPHTKDSSFYGFIFILS